MIIKTQAMWLILAVCFVMCIASVAWAGAGGGSGGTGLLVKGSVPEPASLLALATGVGGALFVRWRRRK